MNVSKVIKGGNFHKINQNVDIYKNQINANYAFNYVIVVVRA